MRTIKFRFFDGEKMCPVGELTFFEPSGYNINSEFPSRGGSNPPMQYTELKDKNGVEIYEGDIVEMETGHKGLGANFGKKNFLIQWRKGGACFEAVTRKYGDGEIGYTLDNGGIFSIEIIGNIHENPELISSDKK